MKFILIIAIILIVLLGYSLKKIKPETSCLNLENYNLIKTSTYADQLCTYKIIREENRLRFATKDGYTLFFIRQKLEEDTMEVDLQGLDGYGMRDKKFKRYVCKLVDQIKEQSSKN